MAANKLKEYKVGGGSYALIVSFFICITQTFYIV